MEQKPGDRPIRIRGIYRAAKRGQQWAIKLFKKRGTFSGLLDWYWYRVDFGKLLSERSFLDSTPKIEPWASGYLPISFGGISKRKRSFYRNKPGGNYD